MPVCASGGLKRESNSLAPVLKLRRNQVALANPAAARIVDNDSPQAGPASVTRSGPAIDHLQGIGNSLIAAAFLTGKVAIGCARRGMSESGSPFIRFGMPRAEPEL
jgi:hypothetical protein